MDAGTIPQVYQELLDIFWPSRLRQQMLMASPLSCSYGDMAQAWGYTPSEDGGDDDDDDNHDHDHDHDHDRDDNSEGTDDGGGGGGGGGEGSDGSLGGIGVDVHDDGDNNNNNNNDDGSRRRQRRRRVAGARARNTAAANGDSSPVTGTILFPADRNYLAFQFEFVIAAVLKKHQAFSQEWCVSFRNSTFSSGFIEQFCASLHHFPTIQSLVFRISRPKQAAMHSGAFDSAIYAMLVPGVLPEWINWITFDGVFQDRAAPQVSIIIS